MKLLPMRLVTVLAAVLCLGLTAGTARAGWERLGDRSVNDRTDRDEIRVGIVDGNFRWIKLRVEKRAVEFKHVHVVYGNGERDEIDVRRLIPAGGETRPIRLEGNRVIRKVVFYYKTVRDDRRGRVVLYGRD